jgi:hypothetical protein
MKSKSDLPKIILALDAGGSLTHLLNRRQQQTGRNQQDSDHHQDLDQGQACPALWG